MPVFALIIHDREAGESVTSRAVHGKLSRAGIELAHLEARRVFLIEGDVDQAACESIAEILLDPVLEDVRIEAGGIPDLGAPAQLVILPQPGVASPEEGTVLRVLRETDFAVTTVRAGRVVMFSEAPADDLRARINREIANPVIEAIAWGEVKLPTLAVSSTGISETHTIPIRELSDDALEALSLERRMALNLDEMKAVQAHYVKEERDPKDIELEMIAQTWSEHCCHKTLAAQVKYTEADGVADPLSELMPGLMDGEGKIGNLLKQTVFKVTKDLQREWCWSVFADNAGVIAFDETGEWGVAAKVETHNHPSAIEPYGGAATGIGGVIRDIMGVGLGAKPILNTNLFCLGPLDMQRDAVPSGARHPLDTLTGVVSGVRDYGNPMGIPTPSGGLYFDARYTGNPLVYAGCIGVMHRSQVSKEPRTGDCIVVAGGATGRDGLGGATFSSAALGEESGDMSVRAVQVGNAIQEKMVLDVQLQARDRGLYTCVTDCGAGGFSSAIGEMAEGLGARVELSGAPLKYEGLSAYEIWLSEAQERMVYAVPPEKVDEFIALYESENVSAVNLGVFTDDNRLRVNFHGDEVLDLDLGFLHDGRPKFERVAHWEEPAPRVGQTILSATATAGDTLRALLAHPNICSREWIIRQYDHEVQAGSTLKPMAGAFADGPSDAAAVSPLPESSRAVIVSSGLQTGLADHDPFWMTVASIDEAIRNAVCSGANVDHLAILDNFSWGDCRKPDRMAALVRACAACYTTALAMGTPFISGKDSLNNEFVVNGESICIPHTLLITAVGVAERAHITTMDLKGAGNLIYQIGLSTPTFAGSTFAALRGESGSGIPRYDAKLALAIYRALNQAQAEGVILSAHDCSEGGLAVAVAEMAFTGRVGVELQLSEGLLSSRTGIPARSSIDQALLFAECNSRILVEVAPDQASAFESCFTDLPCTKIGETSTSGKLTVLGCDGAELLRESLETLRDTWRAPLYAAVGEATPAPFAGV